MVARLQAQKMLPDVGMVKMYSKSANVNYPGFAWTSWPPSLHGRAPPPCSYGFSPGSCCVCVHYAIACFLLHCHQTRYSCLGHSSQVIAGLTSPILQFTESYPSISTFSFADDHQFLNIVPI